MKFKTLLIFIILFIISFPPVFAQDNRDGLYFGPALGYRLEQPRVNFTSLPDVPNCCPTFQSGSGYSLTPGIGLLYSAGELDYGLSVSFRYSSIKFEESEAEWFIVDNQPYLGSFTHTIDAEMLSLTAAPFVKYRLFAEMYVGAAAEMSFLNTATYSQQEKITDPADRGQFTDTESNIRNENSGDIAGMSSFVAAVGANLSYKLPLNNDFTTYLEPMVFTGYGLTNIIDGIDWKEFSYGVGITLYYKLFTPEKKETITAPPMPEIKIEEPIFAEEKEPEYHLSGTVDAVGLDTNGTEQPDVTIHIEEFVSDRYQPLLNYIFFDDNSSEILPKYEILSAEQAAEFKVTDVHKNETLQTYYHLMNIVGRRMKKNPAAKLEILGCNSGVGAEKDNLQLSKDRAEKIYDYFANVWKIEPARLSVKSRGLSDKASTPIDEEQKIEENRRVELFSDTKAILEPVLTRDTLRTANPPFVRFKTDFKSEAGVKEWEIISYQDADLMNFDTVGTANTPDIIDWKLTIDKNKVPYKDEPLNYKYLLWDSKGTEFETDEMFIPLQLISIRMKRIQRLADKEIGKYNLILFDFNSADISKENREIIDYIKTRIEDNSEITITGFTDITGSDEYNRRLSERRAESAKRLLARDDANVVGFGKYELYDNKLPEGRFYCRTVEVLIETPINE